MYTAIRGQGSFCNDFPISISNTEEMISSVVATGIPQNKKLFPEIVQSNLSMLQNEAQGFFFFLLKLISKF